MAVYSVNQATQMLVGATQGTIGNDTYYTAEGVPTIIVPAGSVIYENGDLTVADLADTAIGYQITIPESITAGDEYIVRVHVTTDSGVANTYLKTIGVVAESAKDTAKVIGNLLNKALKRDIEADFTVDASQDKKVIITPVKHWTLGKRSVIPTLYVEVVCIKSATMEGEDLTAWITPVEVPMDNGLEKLQDLEWFCAGERGDQYRGVSYPNDIPFKSKLASVTNSTKITMVHFAYTGSNEAVQKSEQTLVIVGDITTPDSTESSNA